MRERLAVLVEALRRGEMRVAVAVLVLPLYYALEIRDGWKPV